MLRRAVVKIIIRQQVENLVCLLDVIFNRRNKNERRVGIPFIDERVSGIAKYDQPLPGSQDDTSNDETALLMDATDVLKKLRKPLGPFRRHNGGILAALDTVKRSGN